MINCIKTRLQHLPFLVLVVVERKNDCKFLYEIRKLFRALGKYKTAVNKTVISHFPKILRLYQIQREVKQFISYWKISMSYLFPDIKEKNDSSIKMLINRFLSICMHMCRYICCWFCTDTLRYGNICHGVFARLFV